MAHCPIGVLYPYSPIFVGDAFDVHWDCHVSGWFHDSYCRFMARALRAPLAKDFEHTSFGGFPIAVCWQRHQDSRNREPRGDGVSSPQKPRVAFLKSVIRLWEWGNKGQPTVLASRLSTAPWFRTRLNFCGTSETTSCSASYQKNGNRTRCDKADD